MKRSSRSTQAIGRWTRHRGVIAMSVVIVLAVFQGTSSGRNPGDGVDGLIDVRYAAAGLHPAGSVDDATFLRRAYLDVTGCIPSVEQANAFLNDSHPEKHRRLIDTLLASDQYAEHWVAFWGDLLRLQSRSRPGRVSDYKTWLLDALRGNAAYDDMLRQLLTSRGTSDEQGAVGFVLRDRGDPLAITSAFAQNFLGLQIQCAQCHNHPYIRYTQRDFYDFAAYFGEVDVKRRRTWPDGTTRAEVRQMTPEQRQKLRRMVPPERRFEVLETGRQQLEYDFTVPEDKSATFASATLPTVVEESTGLSAPAQRGAARQNLATWMTSRDNTLPARVLVNRLWAKLMGAPLQALDRDFALQYEPTHPELLDFLARELVESDYDVQHVLRLVLNSKAYARQSSYVDGAASVEQSDSLAAALYAVRQPRRLTGEQMYDSLCRAFAIARRDADEMMEQASASDSKRKRRRAAPHSADLPSPAPVGSIPNLFDQHQRDAVYEREATASVAQILELWNGRLVNAASRFGKRNPLRAELQGLASDAERVRYLYLATLTRLPDAREMQTCLRALDAQPGPRGWEDVQWALVNTREFRFIP